MVLVTEMADSGENHCHAELIGGRDDVLVFDTAARLDDGGCAGGSYSLKSIGKGEEGVGGGDASSEWENGFDGAEPCRVDTAHLTGSNAEGLAVFGVNNGVGLDVLADAPCEEQAA